MLLLWRAFLLLKGLRMGVSFNKVIVVGIGLIGGSILKTIKELKMPFETYGVDLNEGVTKLAHNQR